MNPTLQSPAISEEKAFVRNIQNMKCYQDTAPGIGAVKVTIQILQSPVVIVCKRQLRSIAHWRSHVIKMPLKYTTKLSKINEGL